MTFTPEQTAELAKPLDPKHVKPPKKFGPKGDYIEGWHAIAEANRIFGFDGWSYSVELIRDDLREVEVERKNQDGAKWTEMQWQAAYTCICTVTAGGVSRQDVGFGSGFAKMIGDAIEGATKEATTDALKRCLRTFGHPFGLALYDKERANVQAPAAPTITDEQRDELALLAQAANVPLLRICEANGITDLRQLPADRYEAVRKKLNLTIDQNTQKKEAA